MKILLVGDVVGRPGRRAVHRILPALRREHAVDFVIVNAENAAAGYGITASTARELLDAGADCLTTGNHVWAQKEAYELVERDHRILRPANFPPEAPGRGASVYEAADGHAVGVINLIGRIFMDPADCPLRIGRELAGDLGRQCDAIIVDFHAEATSEKAACAFHLDGLVTAVIGTHTHVQTADERIFPHGTAFISDCGMTGPVDTVIGVKPEIVVRRFVTGLPARFDVPKGGAAVLSAVLVETNPRGLAARTIDRIRILTDGTEEVS